MFGSILASCNDIQSIPGYYFIQLHPSIQSINQYIPSLTPPHLHTLILWIWFTVQLNSSSPLYYDHHHHIHGLLILIVVWLPHPSILIHTTPFDWQLPFLIDSLIDWAPLVALLLSYIIIIISRWQQQLLFNIQYNWGPFFRHSSSSFISSDSSI